MGMDLRDFPPLRPELERLRSTPMVYAALVRDLGGSSSAWNRRAGVTNRPPRRPEERGDPRERRRARNRTPGGPPARTGVHGRGSSRVSRTGEGGPPLTVRMFGALTVQDGPRGLGPRDLGGARPKQVLEILLAARGHRVPVDRLAELLWAGEPPRNVAGSLQTFVSVLRRHLTRDRERARRLVITERQAYRIEADLVALDLDRFDALLERSAREPTRLARASLEQALDLVRGEVLEDEPYATWAMDLRGTYQGRILGARLDAADAALADRDFGAALRHSDAAAVLNRFSERAHRARVLALYALGRPHEALVAYRDFRDRLDRELGLEPAAETRAVESAVIRQDDPLSLLPRAIGRAHAVAGAEGVRLLGRTEELETLTGAVRGALGRGVALIHVEGDGGLGKTRLLDELAGRLLDLRVGRSAASALEQHLPYVPIASALRDALAGVELDAGGTPALGQILPELRIGAAQPRLDQVDVLEALVALVARHGPLVLLLDDLHWADPSTLAAVGYLQRRGGALAAVIVTAARSRGTTIDDPLRGLSPDTLVRLEPLSADDLAPLGMPELHEATGGNPRFVTEALANAGAAIPSRTLSEALLAQCRAEGPWAHRVLSAAAVLEPPFDPEPLANLLRADPAELIEELERLCERRILRIDGLRFRFRYEMVRQVLLGSVSPARQRLLHERLAGHVEAAALDPPTGSRAA
jgi:DNA-binding SARP family transcriptional activator